MDMTLQMYFVAFKVQSTYLVEIRLSDFDLMGFDCREVLMS